MHPHIMEHSTLKTAAFHTLGCKLNFAETSTIARQLTGAGYEKVSFDDQAHVYVINTCSVTENADRECKFHVKRAMKANPEGLVVIVGCYAQLKPEEISAIEGVDLVLGAKEKFNILSYLDDLQKTENHGLIHSCEIDEADFFIGSYSIGDRTRAFLKVQDGCDYKCTYCTIPLARGISRSDTIENVVKNAKEIAGKGIKEIVLTGVNIGDYGKGEFGNKKHEHTFLDLISELDQVEGIERIRISSIEPNLLKDESIDLVSKSRSFVPHFHIPLQSGSDDLLKLMKRRYLTKLYSDRIYKIREVMPDSCIGVDVIVGFPGETDEHFLETYHFLNDLDICSAVEFITYQTGQIFIPGQGGDFKGSIDDVKIYNYARTQEQILEDMGASAGAPAWVDDVCCADGGRFAVCVEAPAADSRYLKRVAPAARRGDGDHLPD